MMMMGPMWIWMIAGILDDVYRDEEEPRSKEDVHGDDGEKVARPPRLRSDR